MNFDSIVCIHFQCQHVFWTGKAFDYTRMCACFSMSLPAEVIFSSEYAHAIQVFFSHSKQPLHIHEMQPKLDLRSEKSQKKFLIGKSQKPHNCYV